VQCELLMIS